MAKLLRLLLRYRICLIAAPLLVVIWSGRQGLVARWCALWAGLREIVLQVELPDWRALWAELSDFITQFQLPGLGVLFWILVVLIMLLALTRQFGLFWLAGFFSAAAFLSFHAYRAAASDDLVTLIGTGVALPILVVYFFFKWTEPLAPQRRGVVHIRDRDTRGLSYRTEPAAANAKRFWPHAVLAEASYHNDESDAKRYVKKAGLSWQLQHAKGGVWRVKREEGESERQIKSDQSASGRRLARKERTEADAVNGLYYQVWMEPTQNTIAVVFRGTRPTSVSDWIANLHWVLGLRDHYTNIEDFIAKLLAKHIEEIAKPGYKLVCAGHSLGGGLARQLAFCYPGVGCQSIEVYGFDSSAVDGRLWTRDRDLLRANCGNLAIHEVFERGEVLSLLRNLVSYIRKPRSGILYYRFNYSRSANLLASHNMADLASELKKIADDAIPSPAIGFAAERLQLRLIYDYIKFHIGLYMATPVLLTVFGYSFDTLDDRPFRIGLVIMVVIFALAGMHASFFMGNHVNRRWHTDHLREFQASAFSTRRRFLHHWMYWAGLLAGIAGFLLSLVPVQGGS